MLKDYEMLNKMKIFSCLVGNVYIFIMGINKKWRIIYLFKYFVVFIVVVFNYFFYIDENLKYIFIKKYIYFENF